MVRHDSEWLGEVWNGSAVRVRRGEAGRGTVPARRREVCYGSLGEARPGQAWRVAVG